MNRWLRSTLYLFMAALALAWVGAQYPARAQDIVCVQSGGLWDITVTAPGAKVKKWTIKPEMAAFIQTGDNTASGKLPAGLYEITAYTSDTSYRFERVSVGGVVPPTPDPVAGPTAELTSNVDAVKRGDSAILSYKAGGTAKTATFNGENVALSGTKTVAPQVNTVYIYVAFDGDKTAVAQRTITVSDTPPPVPPTPVSDASINLTAYPVDISTGETSFLLLVTSGIKVATISNAGDGGGDLDVDCSSGRWFGSVKPAKTTEYTAKAKSPAIAVTKGIPTATIRVGEAPPTPPTPIKAEGLHILFREESADRAKLDEKVRAALIGRAQGGLRDWSGNNAVTGKDGQVPAFRLYDKDLTEAQTFKDEKIWTEASKYLNSVNPTTPWVLAFDDTKFLSQAIGPDTGAELLKLWPKAKLAGQEGKFTYQATKFKLYDDSNYKELLNAPANMKFGLKPRNTHPRYATEVPAGFSKFNEKLTVIPKAQWSAWIKFNNLHRMFPVHYCDFPVRNQESTNFCWANGPCAAMEIKAREMGLPHVATSAASIACKINDFRNEGGWGIDAMEQMTKTGIAEASTWPNAAINRKYDTAAADATRLKHFSLEWIQLTDRSFEELVSALLLGHPVAVGYNWWSHEVVAVAVVETSPNVFAVLIWNSWGEWGDKNDLGISGFSLLSQSKATPDDACMVRTRTPYTTSDASRMFIAP